MAEHTISCLNKASPLAKSEIKTFSIWLHPPKQIVLSVCVDLSAFGRSYVLDL